MAPPSMEELSQRVDIPSRLLELIKAKAVHKGKYLHWDEMRYREPPHGLTLDEWWLGTKFARKQILKPVPLRDKQNRPFQYAVTDEAFRLLHAIDQNASGRIQIAEQVTNPATRDRYIINSLIEEAITSSQLEGAVTTADVAKKMIRSGRRPADKSERMIYNNYKAMQLVRERVGQPLTPDVVFELHRTVVAGTLRDDRKAGCLREDADEIVVEDHQGRVLHVPPAARDLRGRLVQLCDFANERDDLTFVHPVLRAIILHFWIGYDHPFVDGNSRTARALFYWSMLCQGYWLTEYLSISRILRKAPAKYGASFLKTESDENDLTYFILYQLRVFESAMRDLHDYLNRKVQEVRQVQSLIRRSADFNYRQLAILSHALRNPGMQYTIQSHRTSHNVSYQTARNDLLELAGKGYLEQGRAGRAFIFLAPQDLPDLLRSRRRKG